MPGVFRDRILAGNVACVTGGGGIGRRMAERFAQHGASVVIAGRNPDPLEGGIAQAAPVDVSDYAATEQARRATSRTPATSLHTCAGDVG